MVNKIEVNLESLKSLAITPNEYCYLYCLHNSISEFGILQGIHLTYNLEKLGFIKVLEDEVILRQKAIDMFSTPSIPSNKEDLGKFVEEYRDLFPQGVKSGARLVKGDKQGCLTKFKAFKQAYPEYTQEEILTATRAYVDLKRKDNYSFMISADYFISKDKLSMLASYCEDIRIRGNIKLETEKNKGLENKTML